MKEVKYLFGIRFDNENYDKMVVTADSIERVVQEFPDATQISRVNDWSEVYNLHTDAAHALSNEAKEAL